MNIQIQHLLQKGNLILLLGAGASKDSTDAQHRPLLDGRQLAKHLAEAASLTYDNEALDVVYSAALQILGKTRLSEILRDRFSGCNPSPLYVTLAKYPWNRIYTLNIDDAFERALDRHSPQKVQIRQKNDPIIDQDQNFLRLDYVKINGCVNRISEGLIFSPQEYGAGSAKTPTWYSQLAQDYFGSQFLFIGTKLREPLLSHQIERFRERSASIEPTSFLLTPSASEIERAHLRSMKVEHIAGTGKDFADFLAREIPEPPSPRDLAIARRPELAVLYDSLHQIEREKYIDLVSNVLLVSRQALQRQLANSDETGGIRDFYKGFKPRWKDILDDVPARLSLLDAFLNIFDDLGAMGQLVTVFGPAGSGKTTLLMQSALILHERLGVNCYFIREPTDNLYDLVGALDKANSSKYFIFSDSLDLLAEQIVQVIESGRYPQCTFVVSERQHVWEDRVKAKVDTCAGQVFKIPLIDATDAEKILEKLREFGPWTRLQAMSGAQRTSELVQRSKRQLLIGLMETTRGKGFEEIIRADFDGVKDDALRWFVLAVGLATVHRRPMSFALAARIMDRLGVGESPTSLVKKLTGIAHATDNSLWIRHPVYVREIYDSIVSVDDAFVVIVALLEAFSAYRAPVIKSVSKSDGVIFKSTLNHKFLRKVLRANPEKVVDVYRRFETVFSVDGLYWLQYGLALRDMDDQDAALEKLETAYQAYPMVHTEHALAQQKLVIALRSTNRQSALSLLADAKEMLNRLDSVIESDDTYPIVTLSEGHTQIVERFDGIDAARKVAERYAEAIASRFKRIAKPRRLSQAESRLKTFALTGKWPNAGDPVFEW